MKLIVGLGNPGKRFDGTRHNLGFAVIDELAGRWDIDLKREKFHAWFGEGAIRGHATVLLKPTTFMNRSGQAVSAAGRFYKLEKADLLVVLDDVALPLGRLRVRKKGSAGSHNGLDDVIARIGFSDFVRLRLGVGGPVGDQSVYVLSRFGSDEMPVVGPMVSTAADAIETWLADGIDAAMNRFNKRGEDADRSNATPND